MTKRLSALLLLLLFCAPHAALADPEPIFLTQPQDEEGLKQRKRCLRKVTFDINGQIYATSRTRTLNYTTMEGMLVKSADPIGPAIDCKITDVGKVSGFNTGYKHPRDYDLQLRALGGNGFPPPPPTTYQENKRLVEESMKNMEFRRPDDGTRVFKYNKTVIYLLPRNIAPTTNNEPVAVICQPDKEQTRLRAEQLERKRMKRGTLREDDVKLYDVCRARYEFDGISFGYSYFEDKPGDHLALDLYLRKRLEKLKFTPTAEHAMPEPDPDPLAQPWETEPPKKKAPAAEEKTDQ
jgi:hypothetical protein